MTAATGLPKSYLPADRKERLFREGGNKMVYLGESNAAGIAGDEDTAWAWLRLVEFSASTLQTMKARTGGADLIRRERLNTKKAEEAFGPDWLDRDDV